jgi:hypothetical protein
MIDEKIEALKYRIIDIVKGFFEEHYYGNAVNMTESFKDRYITLVEKNQTEVASEIEGMQNLIMSFKPALSSVLEPCEEFDMLMTMMLYSLKAPWEGAHRRKKKPPPKHIGPILPGSDPTINITFICSRCDEEVDVPYETKMKILNSDEVLDLPTHCGEPVTIRISQDQEFLEVEEVEAEESIAPIELLMGYIPADNVEYMKILSVGIDWFIHISSHLLEVDHEAGN